jgi:transcriptional regulator with XRE-family HTH domain
MKIKATSFGKTIQRLQAQHGISNKELARKLGVSPARISYMKNTSKPHMITIHKLSKAFDVDAAFFFDQNR